MGVWQAVKMALRSVMDNKIRSILTMLGIIIGVAAVITLVSLVDDATSEMVSTFEDMGTNLLTVNLRGRGTGGKVKLTDFEELCSDYPTYFEGVCPSMSGSATAKAGTADNITTSITGTNEAYSYIRTAEVQEGRFINDMDVAEIKYVAVVGTYIQQELFDGQNPVGETIKLNGTNFKIIGLLEETQSSSESGSDNMVIIPYTTAERFMKSTNVNTYYVNATNTEITSDAKSILESFLLKKLEDENAYTVVDMSSIIEQVNEMIGTLSLMLGGIAGISLVVGGIGIMNIMLVTVTERTREIGVRKAIGARRKSILGQFLIEAIVVSGCGGILGIILGTIATIVVGKMIGINAFPSFFISVFSFLFSAAIGVFFGLYPANKASKLNPIDALRYQ